MQAYRDPRNAATIRACQVREMHRYIMSPMACRTGRLVGKSDYMTG